MIIQVLANVKEEGYLDKGRHPTIAPFFAGGNVAFRREAVRNVGGYDPACRTGEDCDICARLSAAGYELYMRRTAVVLHNNPTTWRRLVQQWYGYGRYHPYVFAKHNPRAVELYTRLRRPVDGELYACRFYKLSPFAAVVFVTKFLTLNLVAAATLGAWLLGWPVLGLVGIGLTSLAAASYSWSDFRGAGVAQGAAFAVIRYIADASLFIGALIGGITQRMLYLSASIG